MDETSRSRAGLVPRAAPAVAWLLLAGLLLGAGVAVAAEATLNIEVPPRERKSVRLTRLPRGAVVSLEVRAAGRVDVAFVDAEGFRRLPALVRPLFRGAVTTGRLAFSVTVPAAGDYFVVLDNGDPVLSRAVELDVHAVAGRAGAAPTPAPRARGRAGDPDLAAADARLRELHDSLRTLFVFEPFPVDARVCGAPNAFAGDFGVVLCREYVQRLYAALGDREKASAALLFTLFHEFAHVLLKQWRYPFYDNEDVADEFASALFVLLGQGPKLRAQAEYFARSRSAAEALAKTFRDDRHSLSVQRARNLLRWSADPDLLGRWQTIFVPRLQTPVLERLRASPPAWLDRALVEQALTAGR